MRVLGIDCGTECTGYGVVEMDDRDHLNCLGFGGIKLSSSIPLPQRLSTIFEQLTRLLECHRPERVAIEEVFYSVNAKSALKLGQVRGVSIKSAVVGYGRAEKQQVQMMVAQLLRLEICPQPADAADALAIAICDLHTRATLNRQRAVVGI